MNKLINALPPGYARVLITEYERWTTIPSEVPAAAMLASLTLPLIRERAQIERMRGVRMDARLWLAAAGRSGAGKTTSVRDIRRRIGHCDVPVLDEASGAVGLLDALGELDGAAVFRVTEEAGLHWQSLRDGDRNAIEMQRYDLRLYDRDPITRRSGEKRLDINPGAVTSLEFAVLNQLPESLSRADIESGFASRRCWLLASDEPVDPKRVKKRHLWDFPEISLRLERCPMPIVPVEPLYVLSPEAEKAWHRAWGRLVDGYLGSVGEAYLRRVDDAGLVCSVICRRLAGKPGPILDAADIRFGSAWTQIFCEGAADLIGRVAGGKFFKRLQSYEEWIEEFMWSEGRPPDVREFQRRDQRNLTAEIAKRELPRIVARIEARRLSHPVTRRV